MSDIVETSHIIVDDFVAPRCQELVKILYQDNDILLINKPSGLLCLSGKNPLNQDSVHSRLTQGQTGESRAYPEAKLPHRLDLGTSGIMVVGLNEIATRQLNQQFQARSVQKRYIALLEGWLSTDHGRVSAPIARDAKHFPKVKICQATGKEAVSEYSVLARLESPRRSLVTFTPLTGRTHQLRIHSLSMGHPITGCDLYKSEQSERMAERLQLHASEIMFQHPVSGKPIHGQCPCPF